MSFTSKAIRALQTIRVDSDDIGAGLARGDIDGAWVALRGIRQALREIEPYCRREERRETKKRERIENSPRPPSKASRQLGELLGVKGYDATLIALRLEKLTGVKYPKRRILAWRIEREVVPLQLLKHIDHLWRLQFTP